MVSNAKFKMNGIWHSWHSCQNEEDYKKNRIYSLGFLLPLEVGPQNRGTEGHLKFSQNLPFVSLILFVESLIFIFLNQKCIVIMSKKV